MKSLPATQPSIIFRLSGRNSTHLTAADGGFQGSSYFFFQVEHFHFQKNPLVRDENQSAFLITREPPPVKKPPSHKLISVTRLATLI